LRTLCSGLNELPWKDPSVLKCSTGLTAFFTVDDSD
jgi:hypothetical protein